MPEIRTGGFVTGDRKGIGVVIQGQTNTVLVMPPEGGVRVVAGLGFKNDDVFLDAKRAFSKCLYDLTLQLDRQITKSEVDLDQLTGEVYEQNVRKVLTLEASTRDLALYDLKDIGSGLRNELNKDFAKKLGLDGLMKQSPENNPTINFQNFQQVPVLWDMMYEEVDEGEDVVWEHFWGFKLALTHWDALKDPPNRIKLKRGLFSAIDQKLFFAAAEVSLLAQQMTGGLSHRSLCDELKSRVAEALRGRNEEYPDEWLKQQGADAWLSHFIEKKLNHGVNDANTIKLQTRQWKDKAIRSIFSDPNFTYEMIHFACHCEPHEVSELLSQLRIHIAGEDVSLTVASMGGERRSDQPGPVVFLNACGTGQQGPSAEPPGFPENWISKREAVAVVATLCPVPDLFAHAFARKFYENLFKSLEGPNDQVRERYLSEALLETRRYFMKECGNPLGLAYVLYAVKDACIEPRL